MFFNKFTNVRCKILCKILANRLKKIMEKVMLTSQKCEVKGRLISDILVAIYSIIKYYEKENRGAIILTLDQEKAFDRINYTYLFRILDKLGTK